MLRNRDNGRRIRVRKGPPEDGIHDAEDRGVRPDAERERQDRNDSKARLTPQHARAEHEVLSKRVPHAREPSQLVADRRQRPTVRGAFPPKDDCHPRRVPPQPRRRQRSAAARAEPQILFLQVAGDGFPKIARHEPREQSQDDGLLFQAFQVLVLSSNF